MKTLTVENFGIIKSATINLNGLTVITGNNDTGKSTIGKLVFSLIKAIKQAEKSVEDKRTESLLTEEINNLYYFLRDKPNINNLKFGISYYTDEFIEELKPYINDNSLYEKKKDEFDLIFSARESILKKNNLISKYPKEILERIKQLVKDEVYDWDSLIASQLQKYLMSEFFWNITPKQTRLKTKLKYSEGDFEVLSAEIHNNKLLTTEFLGDSFFDDAILIETPLILQIFKLISDERTLEADNHIKDLIKKIKNTYTIKNDISDKINKIIAGEFYFDEKEKRFYYSKKDFGKIEALNTASGVKSFGLLQLLSQANQITPKKIIIIDEPENHLHPEWQLKYAELIIELLKNDITIILSTHSPYILQALKHFDEKRKKENKEEKITFYLAEIKGNTSTIENITKDLNKTFAKLAKPLTDLVWM